mmetsp:Transcript_33446/g.50436  ORF Transcript_33446/g.50436 Transcript_33446/m.50436 type:complete len:101 (-) Transcript_33446:285-587(-)
MHHRPFHPKVTHHHPNRCLRLFSGRLNFDDIGQDNPKKRARGMMAQGESRMSISSLRCYPHSKSSTTMYTETMQSHEIPKINNENDGKHVISILFLTWSV